MSLYRIGITTVGEWAITRVRFRFLDDELIGTPVGESWRPPPIEAYCHTETVGIRDALWESTGILFLRERAFIEMQDVLSPHAEFLAASDQFGPLTIVHVLTTVTGIDPETAVVPDYRNPVVLRHRVIDRDALLDLDAFRVKTWGTQGSPIYVSEHFKNTWESAGLTGMRFDAIP